MMIWIDRLLFISLLLLIAGLPFSIGGVGIFSALAFVFFLLKKAIQARKAFVNGMWRSGLSLAVPFAEKRVEGAAAFYIAACSVSVIFSRFPLLSLSALLGKTLGAVFLFLATQEALRTPARVRWFIGILFLAMFVSCLDGFWQLAMGHDLFRHLTAGYGRMSAALTHPNQLGGMLLFVVLPAGGLAGAAFYHALADRTWRSCWSALWQAGVFLIFLCSLGLTYSRGAWLGALVSGFLFLLFQPSRWRLLLPVMVSFVLFFSLLMTFYRSDMKVSKTIPAQTLISDMGRFKFWHEAMVIFEERPLVGEGLNTYSEVMKQRSHSSGFYAHNCYLQMAAEVGILGLGTFCWFLASVIMAAAGRISRVMEGRDRALLLAFLCVWIGAMVHAAVDTTLFSTQFRALIWIMAGFLLVAPAALGPETGD